MDSDHYYYVENDGLRYMTRTLTEGDIILETWYSEEHVNKLSKALELYSKERERFTHTYPEITGEYFLTGGSGIIDENHLPTYVHICPAYGCDWIQVYEKTNKTHSYSGS